MGLIQDYATSCNTSIIQGRIVEFDIDTKSIVYNNRNYIIQKIEYILKYI